MEDIWNDETLSLHWSLSYEELELLKTKPEKSHLSFCFQLKHYSYYGAFPSVNEDLNGLIISYLSDQLATGIYQVYNYDLDSRTSQRHRKEILQFLGIQKFTQRHKQDLSQWLISDIFPQGKDVHDAVIGSVALMELFLKSYYL